MIKYWMGQGQRGNCILKKYQWNISDNGDQDIHIEF